MRVRHSHGATASGRRQRNASAENFTLMPQQQIRHLLPLGGANPLFLRRVTLIFVSLLAIAIAHWLLPTTPHALHAVHVVLRKTFIVPIVLAGSWFGIRGVVAAAAISTVFFSLHVLMDWSGQTEENLNQAADVGLFWIVGVLAGYLFERKHRAMRAAEQAHHGILEALASALDAREHNTDRHDESFPQHHSDVAAADSTSSTAWASQPSIS